MLEGYKRLGGMFLLCKKRGEGGHRGGMKYIFLVFTF